MESKRNMVVADGGCEIEGRLLCFAETEATRA